jgi:hypothetical protein
MHTAVALTCSVLVFPITLSAQFAQRLDGVLRPLHAAITSHRGALQTRTPADKAHSETKPFSSLLTVAAAPASVSAAAAEAALVPLRMSSRLLPLDAVLGRYHPEKLETLHDPVRRLAVRIHGLGLYFRLVDPQEAFSLAKAEKEHKEEVDEPATTQNGNTPNTARDQYSKQNGNGREERPGNSTRDAEQTERPTASGSGTISRTVTKATSTTVHEHHHHTLHDRLLHLAEHSHLPFHHTSHSRTDADVPGTPRTPHVQGHHSSSHFSRFPTLVMTPGVHGSKPSSRAASRSRPTSPVRVGAFEENAYTALAARHRPLSAAEHEEWSEKATKRLSESCDELLGACLAALEGARGWAGQQQGGAFGALWGSGGRAKTTKTKGSKQKPEVDEEKGETLSTVGQKRKELENALKVFKEEKRWALHTI